MLMDNAASYIYEYTAVVCKYVYLHTQINAAVIYIQQQQQQYKGFRLQNSSIIYVLLLCTSKVQQ